MIELKNLTSDQNLGLGEVVKNGMLIERKHKNVIEVSVY